MEYIGIFLFLIVVNYLILRYILRVFEKGKKSYKSSTEDEVIITIECPLRKVDLTDEELQQIIDIISESKGKN